MRSDNPIIFLIDTLFDIYIALLLLRFLLQQVGADFYNPISQFIVKLTQPVVKIARRLIPSYRGLDIATLVLVAIFIFIKLLALTSMGNMAVDTLTLLLLSVHDLISLVFDIFIFAIFIQAILSWVNPDPSNPVSSILRSLTAPVLAPVQRYIKPVSGMDLSPIVALIGLMFAKRLVLYIFQML
jgi:YggT family protein